MSKTGSSITYGYNANGKRISKTVNGTTYNYAYLGDTLTDLSWGSNRMHFTYDSLGPASVTYNGNRYFYLKNAQGDVTGLVNASGTQVVSYTYDPWGAPMSVSSSMSATLGAVNPPRYRGYVYDTETGLYYLSSRYYNPVWGRFINADGYASTGQGFTGDNMFAYCNDNPVNYNDSEGTEPELAMGRAASMSWLPAIDGPVPVGDAIYFRFCSYMLHQDIVYLQLQNMKQKPLHGRLVVMLVGIIFRYIQRLIVEKLAFPDIIIIFIHITEVAATSIIFSHR